MEEEEVEEEEPAAEGRAQGASPTALMQAAGLLSAPNPVVTRAGEPSRDENAFRASTDIQPGCAVTSEPPPSHIVASHAQDAIAGKQMKTSGT